MKAEITKREIYLDHASTTYILPEVVEAMKPFYEKIFANPGSLHNLGIEANKYVIEARETIAKILNAKPQEIIFTSGGTESDNLAIKGVALRKKSGHIITSKIEHPAVLRTCEYLESKGFEVTYLEVDNDGVVNLEQLKNSIKDNTILISIMYANNEIGTIQPIEEIGKIAKDNKIIFHTDACQAAGALDLDVEKLNVDLMTLNAGKVYGPKGIGLLYKKESVKLEPLIHGGGHENNIRSGTENVAGIIGFAKALELAQDNEQREKENQRLIELRNFLIDNVLKSIKDTFVNGPRNYRLPNNANISFLNIEGESILLYLNEEGIYVSSGSACSSKSLEISHVLEAIKLKHDAAHGSIRFSLGKRTTKEDIDYVLEKLPTIVESLRKLSPIHLSMEDIRE